MDMMMMMEIEGEGQNDQQQNHIQEESLQSALQVKQLLFKLNNETQTTEIETQ